MKFSGLIYSLLILTVLVRNVLSACDPINDEYQCTGTAQAPTTAGGQCTNAGDYQIWTYNNGSGDGYSKFQNDLKVCASFCRVQDVYGCGFLGTGQCCIGNNADKKLLCCVRDCLRWVRLGGGEKKNGNL